MSVMVIQFVCFRINDDSGLKRLWRTKMRLSRKGLVSADLSGLERYEGLNCANVDRRRTCDLDLDKTRETVVLKSFGRVLILGYYKDSTVVCAVQA